MTSSNQSGNLGRMLRQQRVAIPLTLQELARLSGTSPSHLGRIERGERFPSARVLRKSCPALRLWWGWAIYPGWLPIPSTRYHSWGTARL